MSTSLYSDLAISIGKVVTALICKQNLFPLDTSPLLMLLRSLLTSLAVPRGQYWSHIETAVTKSCCPHTAADGIGGHWTIWAMHLVNGVSCWHHPIPKVSNPDVPVLGCGCHPRAAGAWSIVHGSSDLVTLGNSCDCRKMAF